jgi:hypothetical protein
MRSCASEVKLPANSSDSSRSRVKSGKAAPMLVHIRQDVRVQPPIGKLRMHLINPISRPAVSCGNAMCPFRCDYRHIEKRKSLGDALAHPASAGEYSVPIAAQTIPGHAGSAHRPTSQPPKSPRSQERVFRTINVAVATFIVRAPLASRARNISLPPVTQQTLTCLHHVSKFKVSRLGADDCQNFSRECH